MSGHRPFSELTRDFSPERRRRNALASQRLEVKIQIARIIGEKLLRQNDELAGLLCDPDLDATDRELVAAIERLVAAVAGAADDFSPAQRRRIAELTDEVRGWIAQSKSVQV